MKSVLQQLEVMGRTEAKAMCASLFGSLEGQKALIYILVEVGGIAQPRGAASAEARAYFDGKREAALEIMNLAGFSPFNLALRVLELPQLTQKDLENVHPAQSPPARARRSRRRAAAVPADAIATAHAFAGDAEPTGSGDV